MSDPIHSKIPRLEPKAPAPLKAIIFDMDGLMVDTEVLYWESSRRIAKQHGTSVSDATLRRMMGRSRTDSTRLFANETGINAVSVERLLEQRETIMLELFRAGVQPMPGLLDLLNQFKSKLRFAVATSSARRLVDALLPAIGIADLFEVIQTGDDILNGKPDPEIYLKTIDRLKLSPKDVVVLEDSPSGAMAGFRAGARMIAVPSHLTIGEDFSFADAVVTHLTDAARLIEKMI